MTAMPAKRNAVAFQVANSRDPRAREAGAFWFLVDGDGTRIGIVHACHCGCGDDRVRGGIAFARPGVKGWEPSGEWPKATLKPSIGIRNPDKKDGQPYHWHGFLTNGVFEEC
ncbi:MAG TPA: DUF6527 family protein [Reyranella sp.]|nr:DUF6527 family protein [Reyranella sp.]